MTTSATHARTVADAAALSLPSVRAATPLPRLLEHLMSLSEAIANTPDEQAADRLRVARVRVEAEIVRRCGHG